MDAMQKISVVENEVEAQLLDAELKNRDIPHLIVSYHDTAYDGLFQYSQGWGHVEAPDEFKDRVLAAIEDLRPTDADDG